MNDIPNYEHFTKVEQINKGWSGDKKYYVETDTGEKRLLRISDISEYERKKNEFDYMKRMAPSGLFMSSPLDFGLCNGGKSVYQFLSWCEGEEAKEVLMGLSKDEQYAYGKKAAEMVKRMETIESEPASLIWAENYRKRVEHYIQLYRNCGASFEGADIIIDYLLTRHTCIGSRPTALMHEDFQTDNMVISPDGELYVIDFQMCGQVDPWYVMMSAGVSAWSSIPFARGQMDGYFGGDAPSDFWEKYSYYMTAETLYAFVVAQGLGDEEREESKFMFNGDVERIRNGGPCIPNWYL